MKNVQTVTGTVATDKLGSVLMHEHIYSSSMGVALSYPQLYKEGTEEKIEKDLKEMKANGIETVVACRPWQRCERAETSQPEDWGKYNSHHRLVGNGAALRRIYSGGKMGDGICRRYK